MNLSSHMDALKNKHAALESMIEMEAARPLPDEVTLHDLKRKKLKLKDEMSQLAEA